MTRPRPRVVDRGSAGLLAGWVAAVVVLSAVVASGWAGAVTARHRAGSIADLAALAAARATELGVAAPCAAAAEVAPRGARVELGGTGELVVVEVRVVVPLPGPWGDQGPGVAVGDRAVALDETMGPATGPGGPP